MWMFVIDIIAIEMALVRFRGYPLCSSLEVGGSELESPIADPYKGPYPR
jgi:hypothetical protein